MAGRLLILLIFTGILKSSAAGGPDYGIAINHYNGVFWAHRKQILHLEAPTQGFDISLYVFGKKLNKAWTAYYRYPRMGINLSYLDLGKGITGRAFAILPFIEFRLLEGKNSELNFRMGTGIGYLDKRWDLLTNNQNIAIGSHINANMRSHLVWHRYLFKGQGELNAGAGITHYSNGNVRLPNLGANSIEFMLGIGWNLHGVDRPDRVLSYNTDSFKRSQGLEISLAGGTKETNLIYNKQIYVLSPSIKYLWHYWRKSRFTAGLDMLFDKGYYYRDNPAKRTETATARDFFSLSVKAGHELIMGDFCFISDIGAYLYSPGNFNGRIYQRLGFKYYFNENWFGQLSLKTHFSRADFFEWGFGYYISH